MTGDEKRARNRFFLLQLIRFSGLALVMLGIAISMGAVNLGQAQLPSQLGFIISLIGMIEFFFLPWILARRWKREG